MQPRDLRLRTSQYACAVREFLRAVPQLLANREDSRQLVRSSGSIGANYIEADNALSKRDSRMRIRICLKESRESEYWLRLLDLGNSHSLDQKRRTLIQESVELAKIFATIARKLRI